MTYKKKGGELEGKVAIKNNLPQESWNSVIDVLFGDLINKTAKGLAKPKGYAIMEVGSRK